MKIKLRSNSRIIFREEEDVGVLFNPDNGSVSVLNETGKFIWSRLGGELTREDIVEELLAEFENPADGTAGEDFDIFVKDLGQSGFLENYFGPSLVPASVCFGITSKCNLNCRHCLNRDLPGSGPDMDIRELTGVIGQMGEGGTKNLSLFGGEPLCHPDFKQIVEEINKYPINISLNTNASLIDSPAARWLKAHKISGAVVSFDGSSAAIMDGMRGKGSFEKCLAGVGAMRSEGMSILLSVTLTKLNYEDVRAMALLGRKAGGSAIRFNHVFFGGNAACFAKELYLSPEEEDRAIGAVWRLREEFGDFVDSDSSYLSQKEKLERVKSYKPERDRIVVWPCGAANGKCAIRPDGWVTPCEIMWDVKCGNLKNDTLSDIWRFSEVMNQFRKPLEIDLKDMPECKGCSYQYLCFIGHRCYPYYNPGGLANKGLYCRLKMRSVGSE
ncbi:MAG: PqqD family peptide modification chaperone [Candidatus Omnitrophica bacterium]|nr:PqqD family peptide modification chaperone [Candidatus Omnitrophota bacterium]